MFSPTIWVALVITLLALFWFRIYLGDDKGTFALTLAMFGAFCITVLCLQIPLPDYQRDCLPCIEHHKRIEAISYLLVVFVGSGTIGSFLGWIYLKVRGRFRRSGDMPEA